MCFFPFWQVMMYNGVATVLYLTAFLANAATVNIFSLSLFFGHIGAAAVRLQYNSHAHTLCV